MLEKKAGDHHRVQRSPRRLLRVVQRQEPFEELSAPRCASQAAALGAPLHRPIVKLAMRRPDADQRVMMAGSGLAMSAESPPRRNLVTSRDEPSGL